MRLIDADAFKEYIRNSCEELKPLFPDGGKLAGRLTEEFCKDIDEQPTIDTSNTSNTLGALDCVERQAVIDACTDRHGICIAKQRLLELPSVQPEDWMERNKEHILQAGMEGREIEFRIGGRLFAIREKAQ